MKKKKNNEKYQKLEEQWNQYENVKMRGVRLHEHGGFNVRNMGKRGNSK